MAKAKIAVNGYGTIGKRVADAVRAQDDMEVIGISKTKPNYEAAVANQLGYDIYCPAENVGAFEKAGIPAAGTIEEMVEKADLVVDCTPGGVGETNKPLYQKAGVKTIWQGGESHPLTGFSFNAVSNYEKALGLDLVRVVSCNTTGLCRVITPIDRILLIADIHGNYESLQTVLEIPHDRVICLGDVVNYGPEPDRCIDLLRERAIRTIRGNHDNAVAFKVDCQCGYRYKHLSIATREYTWKILDRARMEYLQKLPPLIKEEIDGKKLYLTHGSPLIWIEKRRLCSCMLSVRSTGR